MDSARLHVETILITYYFILSKDPTRVFFFSRTRDDIVLRFIESQTNSSATHPSSIISFSLFECNQFVSWISDSKALRFFLKKILFVVEKFFSRKFSRNVEVARHEVTSQSSARRLYLANLLQIKLNENFVTFIAQSG